MELNKADMKQLNEQMKLLESDQNTLRICKAQFEDDNRELMERIQKQSVVVDIHKSSIKDQALCDFMETGEKKLPWGIGIRVTTSLDYDPERAMNWARKHDLCLTLDRKSFEKLAKTQDIDFVRKEDTPTVTFPKEIMEED